MSTLEEVIRQHMAEGSRIANAEGLIAALREREDEIATALMVAGAQLAADPALVAKVIQDVGLGTAVSAEEKAFLDAQFVERVNYYNEMFRRMGGPERGET